MFCEKTATFSWMPTPNASKALLTQDTVRENAFHEMGFHTFSASSRNSKAFRSP